MGWSKLFEQAKQPSMEEICSYIHNGLWQELNSSLQQTYGVKIRAAGRPI